MPELIAIETAPTTPPSKRAEHLSGQWRAAADAVNVALHAAGILPRPSLSPGARENPVGIHALRCREISAGLDLTGFLERRVWQLERTIRTVLANGHSEDQRQEMLASVYGKAAAHRRDAALLSDTEAQLVERYRRIDAEGKRMLRTLCARLAETSEPDGGDR